MEDVWGDDLLKSAQCKPKSSFKKPKLVHSKVAGSFNARRLKRCSLLDSGVNANETLQSLVRVKENPPKTVIDTKLKLSPKQNVEDMEISDPPSMDYLSPSKKHCKVGVCD